MVEVGKVAVACGSAVSDGDLIHSGSSLRSGGGGGSSLRSSSGAALGWSGVRAVVLLSVAS